MKTINNFDQIIKYLREFGPKKSDMMYMTAIIVQRAKDFNINEESKKELRARIKESPKKVYFIRSYEDLEKYRDEMIVLARLYNARVYINLSPKSIQELQNNLAQEYS